MMCKQLEINPTFDEISLKQSIKHILYKKYEEFQQEANNLQIVEIDPFE